MLDVQSLSIRHIIIRTLLRQFFSWKRENGSNFRWLLSYCELRAERKWTVKVGDWWRQMHKCMCVFLLTLIIISLTESMAGATDSRQKKNIYILFYQRSWKDIVRIWRVMLISQIVIGLSSHQKNVMTFFWHAKVIRWCYKKQAMHVRIWKERRRRQNMKKKTRKYSIGHCLFCDMTFSRPKTEEKTSPCFN